MSISMWQWIVGLLSLDPTEQVNPPCECCAETEAHITYPLSSDSLTMSCDQHQAVDRKPRGPRRKRHSKRSSASCLLHAARKCPLLCWGGKLYSPSSIPAYSTSTLSTSLNRPWPSYKPSSLVKLNKNTDPILDRSESPG